MSVSPIQGYPNEANSYWARTAVADAKAMGAALDPAGSAGCNT